MWGLKLFGVHVPDCASPRCVRPRGRSALPPAPPHVCPPLAVVGSSARLSCARSVAAGRGGTPARRRGEGGGGGDGHGCRTCAGRGFQPGQSRGTRRRVRPHGRRGRSAPGADGVRARAAITTAPPPRAGLKKPPRPGPGRAHARTRFCDAPLRFLAHRTRSNHKRQACMIMYTHRAPHRTAERCSAPCSAQGEKRAAGVTCGADPQCAPLWPTP